MADNNETNIPGTYEGREQAYIKHRLLEGYLEKLFLILGMGSDGVGVTELIYVDCFAGPWGDGSEEMDGTSIAVSLRILEKCQRELQQRGRKVRFRALYVENNPDSYRRLVRYLQEHTPAGIVAESLPGDFMELRQRILDWCGTQSFVFFFIDPTQWKPVGVWMLEPLLQRPKSEFLINFMYDFVNRAASMDTMRAQMLDLLGEKPDIGHLQPREREKYLLDLYCHNLKLLIQSKWQARSVHVRVLDRNKERPKYHLVYLTTHPKGIVEFMGISESLDQVQRFVRAMTKQKDRVRRTGQHDMFPISDHPYLDESEIDMGMIEEYWNNYLSLEPKKIGITEFSEILEETGWFPGDLQSALGNLIKVGKVRNLDARGTRRTKFLHLDNGGERLQLVE